MNHVNNEDLKPLTIYFAKTYLDIYFGLDLFSFADYCTLIVRLYTIYAMLCYAMLCYAML